MYKNHVYDMVKPFFIDKLINSGKIIMLLRAEGWAVVGHDPIRKKNIILTGSDRRENL